MRSRSGSLILRDLPEIKSLRDYQPKLITRVLDVDGNEIASFATERRIIIPIEEVPRPVVDAFVAAEDGEFYEHQGLDYAGILRAAFTNLVQGRKAQGASTITQQVAKTFLLSSERSYTRKLKDMVLARRIEQSLSKNDILYLYLNQIYFGAGAYGIEAAAQTYFGKSARDLQVHEAAVIAGLVPRPAEWNPHVDPEMARRKQLLVLHRMVEKDFLSQADADAWAAQPLVYVQPTWQERESASAFFVEEVRRYLMAHFGGEEVLTGGLTVHTTLDVDDQVYAWHAVRKGLREHDRRMGYRGPIRNVPKAETEARARGDRRRATPRVAPGEDPLLPRARDRASTTRSRRSRSRSAPRSGPRSGSPTWPGPGEPNPARDGIVARVSRVGQALHVGDLVFLEDVDRRRASSAGSRSTSARSPKARCVAVDLEKAQLRAIVGGYSFAQSEFNRALQSRRQPGSAFKPIVYAAALARGYTPATIVQDTAIVYEDYSRGFAWKPENYSEDFLGPITLRTALAKSRNAATIRILSDIGVAPVRDMARALGIESKMEMNLGLALGNSEVTLAELVRAYTPFAAGGKRIDPIFILEVRDRSGRVIAKDVPLLASLSNTRDAAGRTGQRGERRPPANERRGRAA